MAPSHDRETKEVAVVAEVVEAMEGNAVRESGGGSAPDVWGGILRRN